jgi:hypothetical protein
MIPAQQPCNPFMFDDPTQKLGRNLCFQQTVTVFGEEPPSRGMA